MADVGACAKCQQDKVVVVPAANVGLGYAQENASQIRTGFLAGGVPIDLHVCTSCGYIEHWANTSDANFDRLRQKFGAIQ